jgi:hypothetical protein
MSDTVSPSGRSWARGQVAGSLGLPAPAPHSAAAHAAYDDAETVDDAEPLFCKYAPPSWGLALGFFDFINKRPRCNLHVSKLIRRSDAVIEWRKLSHCGQSDLNGGILLSPV